jgi:hypothetical protein
MTIYLPYLETKKMFRTIKALNDNRNGNTDNLLEFFLKPHAKQEKCAPLTFIITIQRCYKLSIGQRVRIRQWISPKK